MELGQRRTLELQLRNTHRVPKTLEDIILFDTSASGAFSYAGPARLEVPASSSTTLTIGASPISFGQHRGTLQANGETLALVEVVGGIPVAELSPSSLDVPILAFSDPSSYVERFVTLKNLGDSDLVANPIVVQQEEGGGRVSGAVTLTGTASITVRPQAQSRLRLLFHPARLGTHDFHVRFLTNDPHQPEHVLTFHGVAVSLPACSIQVPQHLIFTASTPSGSTGVVSFVNAGDTRCVLDDVRTEGGASSPFRITDGGVSQVELAPGQSHDVSLQGPDAGATRIDSLGFHVLGAGSSRQVVTLRPPPL